MDWSFATSTCFLPQTIMHTINVETIHPDSTLKEVYHGKNRN